MIIALNLNYYFFLF